jgi:Ca-activated chloride channel family protein
MNKAIQNRNRESEQDQKQAERESEKSEEDSEGQPQDTTAQLSDETLSDEEQQALELWLRQVPDNPGGLLRRKFEYEYRKNQGRRQADPNKKIW